jgi:hypothetical protein
VRAGDRAELPRCGTEKEGRKRRIASGGLELGLFDDRVHHLGRNVFLLDPSGVLLLLDLDARGLPGGPVPGDQRPQ